MGAEETAAAIATPIATATARHAARATSKATMGVAATTVAEQTAIREHNPLFQSMGTEEAAMAVADRVEEVAAVEMAVTAMEAAADTTANATVAATAQDTAQESTEEQAKKSKQQQQHKMQHKRRQNLEEEQVEDRFGLRAESLILESLVFDIFPNLTATNFKIWRAKELDIIWFSQVTVKYILVMN